MGFFDKSSVGQMSMFSHSDLMQYVESLLKECSTHQSAEGNYSWLKSRHIHHDYSKDLEIYKPMVFKMTTESCATIAVKLDDMTEENTTTAAILANFRRLLLEQHSIQLISESVRARQTKNRRNRVQPDLGERQAVVSFILD